MSGSDVVERTLPVGSGGLSPRRQLLGALAYVVGLPVVVLPLAARRVELSYATPVLLVLSLVVAVALVGGIRVALPAAILGGLALNWFFTPPYGTLVVDRPEQLLVLAVYLVVAVAVSAVVDLAARRTAQANRARAEAQALASLAGAALSERQTLPDLLERVRQVFGMREVALLEADASGWVEVETTGATEAVADEVELRVAAGPSYALAVRGPQLFAEDRRVLTSFAEAAATALEGRRLAEKAAVAAELEATDRMRTALLAAVGHDLRTPLAGAKAAVSSLRQSDVDWSPAERDVLLETIESATDRLQTVVANLLDASRIEAGVVSAQLRSVGVEEVVDAVLLGLAPADRDRISARLPPGLPDVLADQGLLERVIANLVDNGLRHAPGGSIVSVAAAVRGDLLHCDVIDHGPGVAAADHARVFAPFQRVGDRTAGGLGLGLAVARGLTEAMGGTLVPRTTEGGGLTMRVTLPLVVAGAAAGR